MVNYKERLERLIKELSDNYNIEVYQLRNGLRVSYTNDYPEYIMDSELPKSKKVK